MIIAVGDGGRLAQRILRINRHEQNRAFATRYDQLAVRYAATVEITNINTHLRD